MIKNIVANFFGKFWGLFSNFIFIPIYIRLLGIESYSIISFGLIIAGVMSVLDSGITATLSREMARADNNTRDKQRIFKTLESIYFIITAFIILLVYFNSKYIASSWINTNIYAVEELKVFISIIGIDVGFQLLIRFYLGGLIGMEQQVTSNLFQISWGFMRAGLVAVTLLMIPSLKMFFIWQAVSSVLFGLILCFKFRKALSGVFFTGPPKIEKQVLINSWKFAGGMLLISLVAALNTQMDKLAISKLLPVEQLGYYTLAVSLSMGLMFVVSPISTALLPRMTNYFTANLFNDAHILYSRTQILVSILTLSFSSNLFFYSKELLWIWTDDITLANKSYILLKILCVGITFLALAVIPFNVAIANGYTKLNNIIGLLSLFITMPAYWFFTSLYGDVGAAMVYTVIQIVITFFYLYFISKKFFFTTSLKTIFVNPLVLPLVYSFLLAYGFSLLLPHFLLGRVGMLVWIGITTILIVIIICFVLLPKLEIKLLQGKFRQKIFKM
jgi:O-antigen/teichoic acid export membrane protein